MDELYRIIESVQEKHIEWFKARPPMVPHLDHAHDLLVNHCIFGPNGFGTRWGDLPQYIIDDLLEALKELES